MIPDYVGLAGFRPDLNDKLLDLIHMLTDKKVRESLKGQSLRIDWEEIARAMKGVNTWEMPKVIVPVQTEPASRFDLNKAAPVLRDAPWSISELREKVNQLIHETFECKIINPPQAKLLAILEQIVMKLENVPQFNWSIPSIAPFPMCPPALLCGGTNTPLPIGPTITCNSGESVCQADGVGDLQGCNTVNIEKGDDIPF